jgi:hypothetical protein
LVVGGTAIGLIVQPHVPHILLALLPEESVRGLEPDGPGRGVDPVEADAEELGVELGRRPGGPGQVEEPSSARSTRRRGSSPGDAGGAMGTGSSFGAVDCVARPGPIHDVPIFFPRRRQGIVSPS